MPFKRRCPTCGSKQWHKEPSSGMIACSEGHVLQNYRNESKDMTDIGGQTVRTRYAKKKGQEKDGKANSQLFHGAKGRFLYFQCLQALLRLQVSALIKLWDIPAEFEIVCRDVWALKLCLLSRQIHGDDDLEAEDMARAEARNTDIQDPELSAGEGSEANDSELDRLLREDSESSSSSEEDGTSKGQLEANARHGNKGPPSEERAVNTIAVLVITCWLMRIPVMYQDFSGIIEAYELPYLDSVRLLPVELTSHLTRQSIQSLSPHHAPTTLRIHSITSHFARKLRSVYGIVVPEPNATPLLWRTVRSMGGTPTLYMLAKRLSQVVSLPHTPEAKQGDFNRGDAPIEVRLVAVLIIVLKMVYGLDGKERTPKSPNDPGCSLPSMEGFLANLRLLDKRVESKFDSRRALSIGDLTGEEIDEYLDFCQHALLGEEQTPRSEVLNKQLPLREGGVRNHVQGQELMFMGTASARQRDTGVLPGKDYIIWNGRDIFGSLPRELWEVLQRGGRFTGVDEDYICQVVEKYEEKLLKWWQRVENEVLAPRT